ncbi:hypothetical protein M758_UG088500 [Ceratodon purpureus]|nr:hypothetical protein M758_UG088500 [Ceratodon purpureus]
MRCGFGALVNLIVSMIQDMHRRNSTRLSAMERNQAETNRRLDDILKNNLALQSMLQSVITNLSPVRIIGEDTCVHTRTPSVGETIGIKMDGKRTAADINRGEGSSEQWWDKTEKTSNDDDQFRKVRCS